MIIVVKRNMSFSEPSPSFPLPQSKLKTYKFAPWLCECIVSNIFDVDMGRGVQPTYKGCHALLQISLKLVIIPPIFSTMEKLSISNINIFTKE